jgi:hypothetical protein
MMWTQPNLLTITLAFIVYISKLSAVINNLVMKIFMCTLCSEFLKPEQTHGTFHLEGSFHMLQMFLLKSQLLFSPAW